MRVFLDANILFSATLEGSEIGRLVERLLRGHGVITSNYAYDETIRNIQLKRPACLPELLSLTAQIEIVQSVDAQLPLPIALKDRPILYTAIKSKCDILLTGDKKHFGHLMDNPLGSLRILSPVQMPAILKQLPPIRPF